MTTEVDLIEAERSRILRSLAKLGRPLKGTRRRSYDPNSPSAKALRESGLPEKDVQILVEGNQHEIESARTWTAPATFRRELPERVARALGVLQEDCGDGAAPDAGMMPSTDSGWRAGSTPGTFTHEAHGSLHVKPGKWTHRDRAGVIRGSGATQEAMDSYVRTLKTVGDRGGNPAASGAADANAEAVREVLGRVFNREPRVPAEAHRLVEAVRSRAVKTGGPDLHERLRKAATR